MLNYTSEKGAEKWRDKRKLSRDSHDQQLHIPLHQKRNTYTQGDQRPMVEFQEVIETVRSI
jgi:hypothetical protein